MLFLDPFAPFDSLFSRPLNRAFLPPADVTVSEQDMVLTMDLPGLTADDLEIEVLDGALAVRGERKAPELSDGSTWTHAERAFGRFERRIQLPEGTDPDAITASMDHGVLSLIVPKPERLKPRTVAIQSGERRELAAA